MPEVGRRSREVIEEGYPQIIWEHSHVVMGEEGNLKSYCIYSSPNTELIREHAELLGDHAIRGIYEIGGDISPDDFE